MPRYTPTKLQSDIRYFNEQLVDIGINKRFEYSPRYEWQAIDEYSVDDGGTRIGSGCDFNVETGTSLECYNAMHIRYLQLIGALNQKHS